MDAAKREIWAGHVAKWRASGLGARAFAAKNGINYSTFRWWSDRLRFAAGEPKQLESTRRAFAKPARAVTPPLTFVELTDVGIQSKSYCRRGQRCSPADHRASAQVTRLPWCSASSLVVSVSEI